MSNDLVNRIFLFIFLCINFTFADSHNHSNLFLNKQWQILGSVNTQNFHQDLKRFSELDIDIAGVDIKNNIIDLLLSDYDFIRLQKLGLDVEVMQTKGISKSPDTEYKNPVEIETIVQDFADRYPAITKRISIGKSLEGRDIWAIKISDNPELDESDEPVILFNSMHHAREVMTPEVGIDILETLLTGYGADNKITQWIEDNEIWVIPMFNVDGNQKMWDHDRWWRKNTRDGHGVDLNRNYPTGWNKCNGSSGRRSSQTYRGTTPASEPETQAMMNFISSKRPVFNISYHSYSELVLYPYGCSPERTGTRDVVETVGKELGRLLNYAPGTAWELLYNADGGDIDWMYEQYQVIPYVIEVSSRREGFQPNYKKWRDKTVQRNRVGWQYLLDRLAQSGIRGVFSKNNKTISDFQVRVYKISGKKELFQTYNGQKNGVYHLVLNPGKYELEFIINKTIVKKITQEVGAQLNRVRVEI